MDGGGGGDGCGGEEIEREEREEREFERDAIEEEEDAIRERGFLCCSDFEFLSVLTMFLFILILQNQSLAYTSTYRFSPLILFLSILLTNTTDQFQIPTQRI